LIHKCSSLGLLVVATGVLALDLALARELYRYDCWLPFGIVPSAVGSQIGLVLCLRGKGLGRPFWAGFFVTWSMLAASYSGAIVRARSTGKGPNQTTGQVYPGVCSHAARWAAAHGSGEAYARLTFSDQNLGLWETYITYAFAVFPPPTLTQKCTELEVQSRRIAGILVALAPQLCAATAAGMAAMLLSVLRRRGTRERA
jgi:hypothetical protein